VPLCLSPFPPSSGIKLEIVDSPSKGSTGGDNLVLSEGIFIETEGVNVDGFLSIAGLYFYISSSNFLISAGLSPGQCNLTKIDNASFTITTTQNSFICLEGILA
jgi:hypothetical protein